MLPSPFNISFTDEAEGDAFVSRVEAQLDSGVIPPELAKSLSARPWTVAEALRSYERQTSIPSSEFKLLGVLQLRLGATPLRKIDYAWTEDRIARSLKLDLNLAPSIIRHHVGALARCLD